MSIELLHRKHRIINTAIDVMNEFGVNSLSTREIARREGISEGAIFKHFPKKNNLILEILNFFSQYDQDIFLSLEVKKLKPTEAIIYFIKAYANYYHNYPQITVIIHGLPEMLYNPNLTTKVKGIISSRANIINELIIEGQKQGLIRQETDSQLLTEIIMGSFNYICLKWRLDNYDFSLEERLLQSIRVILKSFSCEA